MTDKFRILGLRSRFDHNRAAAASAGSDYEKISKVGVRPSRIRQDNLSDPLLFLRSQ
jgi:hypothetical protein